MRSLLALSLLVSGCFENIATEFPEGLEPWEEPNEAAPPAGDGYPEELSFFRKRWTGGVNSIHARAYVHADVQTTFDAVRHPYAGADRRDGVGFTWEYDSEPEYEYSHRSHLMIPGVVPVEFWLNWRSGVVERDETDAPTITATRWQKTEGTSAIPVLEGSIVIVEIEPDVSELQIQYHLDALTSGYETIEDYLTGYYVSVLAYVRGEVADPDVREDWPRQE